MEKSRELVNLKRFIYKFDYLKREQIFILSIAKAARYCIQKNDRATVAGE